MKKLVTITGAPTTKSAVVKDLAKHFGKAAVIFVVTKTIGHYAIKGYFERKLPK